MSSEAHADRVALEPLRLVRVAAGTAAVSGAGPTPAGQGRIADIEVLRGIAVLCVIVHHARDNLFVHAAPWIETLFAYWGGWFGVDLFFAISGFVIARNLLPVLAACPDPRAWFSETKRFWLRRIWRLVPSAWLWLGVMLAATVCFNRSGVFGSVSANLAATWAGMLNYANFRFADSIFRHEYGSSFAYWSLSLEEQFYFLLPCAVLLFRRSLPWVLAVCVIVQFCTLRGIFMMATRTDALLLGVLLAMFQGQVWYRRLEPQRLLQSRWARSALVSLLVLGLGMLATDHLTFYRFRVGDIALCSALLVWLASYNRGYIWPSGVTQRWMMYLGSRSYGLYLIHIPAFFLTREIAYRLGPTHTAALWPGFLAQLLTCIVLLFGLAELNFRLVERPLRDYGKRLTEAPCATTLRAVL